jgi:D-alanine transaminase
MPRFSYVNGRYVPHAAANIHIEDRGLQFCDSVYDIVSIIDGHMADEAGHLDRLERSVSELGIHMPMTRKSLQLTIRELARRNKTKNAVVYIQVTRGTAPRDFKIPALIVPNIIITLRDSVFDIPARKATGRKAITVPDIRWQRRDIKTTGLLAQVLAKQKALDSGAYEAWMYDEKGFITEASASNAWIVDKKGHLITRPTANNNILKGVTRSALQILCKKEGIKLVERAFTVKEARAAAEAFTTAASSLLVPIIMIDGHKIGNGKIGPLTSRIYDLYMDYATDKNKKPFPWNPK